MNKQEFIDKLRVSLLKLPKMEVEDRIAFYSEMIDDKIEDGFSEREAVEQIGDIDEIVLQIKEDIQTSKNVSKNIKQKRKLRAWEIVLIVLGSPIWLSLLVSVVAVVLSVYACLWAGVITLWAGVVTLCAMALYGIVFGGIMMFFGDTFANFVLFSLGIVSVGLAIFLSIGSFYTTKGLIILTKKIIIAIKNSFAKKEVNNE